jgi:hypothetical protein
MNAKQDGFEASVIVQQDLHMNMFKTFKSTVEVAVAV